MSYVMIVYLLLLQSIRLRYMGHYQCSCWASL